MAAARIKGTSARIDWEAKMNEQVPKLPLYNAAVDLIERNVDGAAA